MSNSKSNTKEIILKLKEVRNEQNLSLTDIERMLEDVGEHLSRSTISRVFSEDSEETSFRYDETIRPLVKALLDVETIADSDNSREPFIIYLNKLELQ